MADSLKSKTVKGTLWSSIERFSVQGIQFIVMIIMARILTPSDYGLVGMIAIFIAVSQSLIDSGFSQALIRKQDRSEIDNSTVFYFNIAVGITLYLVLFLSAPAIARFYNEPQLTSITRIIGLGLLFNSLGVVQRAIFTTTLNFKTQAKATLIGAVTSGIIGISMAYCGYGVWAIVAQQMANIVLVNCFLWVFSKWRPILKFSKESFTSLFSFGSKLMISGLIDTLYKNMYLIVIGKFFRAQDLGYYTRAHQFSDFASSNFTGIFQRVSYPVLCTIQDNNCRLADVYRRLLKVSSFIIFPLMTGLAACATPLIDTILTSKWIFAAQILQILCLAQMWYPVHAINLNLLQVKGRSDLFLKLEIIKKLIGVAVLCATLPFGLIAVCWGVLINSLLSLIINTHYTGKLINLGFLAQIKDLFPTLALSLFTGIAVRLSLSFIELPSFAKLIIGVIEGIVLYAGTAYLFRFTEFKELTDIMRRR